VKINPLSTPQQIAVHWFRRDLRLDDNAALYHALKSGLPVQCVFILDENILSRLHKGTVDKRLVFIHQQLVRLSGELEKVGASLAVYHDTAEKAWQKIVKDYPVKYVFTNNDYEPYARTRDNQVGTFLTEQGIEFFSCKDHVIFAKDEVVKDDGTPYTVFTPYKNKYRKKLNAFYLKSYPVKKYSRHFLPQKQYAIPPLRYLGFEDAALQFSVPELSPGLLKAYAEQRDIPSVAGTSRMSLHLRFGTVSVRELFRMADQHSDVWTNELIWREFYMQILWHYPHVAKSAFKSDYDRVAWRNNEEEFAAWCEGRTGYPLVDAGMRELNSTGFMHNRVRMVVASFLVKHLLIDYRWGETYFAEKLLDFDLSANNGGWQWAAGCGTDAAPYFRIFNPHEQLKRFDPELKYVKKWVPEYGTDKYPAEIVEHKFARERCLKIYKASLSAK
jgi:deoxyribodipyrimidine photo-lyase